MLMMRVSWKQDGSDKGAPALVISLIRCYEVKIIFTNKIFSLQNIMLECFTVTINTVEVEVWL